MIYFEKFELGISVPTIWTDNTGEENEIHSYMEVKMGNMEKYGLAGSTGDYVMSDYIKTDGYLNPASLTSRFKKFNNMIGNPEETDEHILQMQILYLQEAIAKLVKGIKIPEKEIKKLLSL